MMTALNKRNAKRIGDHCRSLVAMARQVAGSRAMSHLVRKLLSQFKSDVRRGMWIAVARSLRTRDTE